jgi:hypothetical protein
VVERVTSNDKAVSSIGRRPAIRSWWRRHMWWRFLAHAIRQGGSDGARRLTDAVIEDMNTSSTPRHGLLFALVGRRWLLIPPHSPCPSPNPMLRWLPLQSLPLRDEMTCQAVKRGSLSLPGCWWFSWSGTGDETMRLGLPAAPHDGQHRPNPLRLGSTSLSCWISHRVWRSEQPSMTTSPGAFCLPPVEAG